MVQLSRAQFIKICTEAILTVRDTVAVNNQLSGYKKYHREIKENKYLSQMRFFIYSNQDLQHRFMFKHSVIKYAGLGNCRKLADVFLIEIGQKIHEFGAVAEISVMGSKRFDLAGRTRLTIAASSLDRTVIYK